VKPGTLREYAKRYELRVLVETGTFLGDMIEAVKWDFERIYSIEISKELYGEAEARFRKAKNVVLIHGDSAQAIGKIVSELDRPALFWPNAHYSEGRSARGPADISFWMSWIRYHAATTGSM